MLSNRSLLIVAALAMIAMLYGFFFMMPGPKLNFIVPEMTTPAYTDAELIHKAPQILEAGKKYPILETIPYFTPKLQVQITRRMHVYKIAAPAGEFWCTDNLMLLYDNNTREWSVEPWFPRAGSMFPALGLFFLLNILISLRIFSNFRQNKKSYELYFYLYVSIWLFFSILLFALNGEFLSWMFKDPEGYFNIAKEWLARDRHSQIPYSVGTSFIYAPLISFFAAKAYLDIALQMSIITFLLTGLGGFMAFLAIAWRILPKGPSLHITAAACIIYTFTSIIMRYWMDQMDPNLETVAKTCFSLRQQFYFYSNSLFNRAVMIGWNSTGDNYGSFMFIISVFVLFIRIKPIYTHALAGLFLGFAITCRYGIISLIPAIVLLSLALNFPKLILKEIHLPQFIRNLFIMGICVIIGFIPQMIDNFVINANPLTPSIAPHLLKEGKPFNELFGFANIARGLEYNITIHAKLFLPAIVCLYFIKRPFVGLFLWLWIICPLIFHSSLHFVTAAELRYIMVIFPALFIAIGGGLGQLPAKPLALLASLIIINYHFVSPECPALFNELLPFYGLPQHVQILTPVLSGVLYFMLCRGIKGAHATGTAVFFLLFALAGWFGPLFAMLAFPLYLCFRPKAEWMKPFIVPEPEING